MKVAFIGLGAMGFPMARHVQKAGHELTVFNRTTKKAQEWIEQYSGTLALTPSQAAVEKDAVLLCVGNDDDVRQVVYGDDGVINSMSKNTLLIDHTTTSAELSRELYVEAKQRGIHFLDAPVSGGQAGAENGNLTVMLGGDPDIYTRASPILNCYSQKHELMGEAGSGQLTKMVNQICIAGILQGLSEAISFAENAHLDIDKVISVISKGAAQSWQMENRYKTMTTNEFNFGFAIDWMRKDLDIVLAEAKRNGSALPLTAMVDQFYAQVQAQGGNRYDTSGLITLLNRPKK